MAHVPYWLTCTLVLFIWKITRTGTEQISKYVCSGDSIQLFQNIKIDSHNIAVFLFMNGAKSHQIAMWTMQNVTIADGYSKKVYHDSYDDIWIRNVQTSDEAQYTLIYRKGSNSFTSEVNLTVLDYSTASLCLHVFAGGIFYSFELNCSSYFVSLRFACGTLLSSSPHYEKVVHLNTRMAFIRLVRQFTNNTFAPTKNCKPKLKRVGDILSASLDAHDCGKPAAYVYWLNYPGIHYEGNDLVKLPPKYKAGTYYACIKGLATRCEKNSTLSDYCSKLTTDDITSELGAESSRIEASYVMLIVLIVVTSVSSVVIIVIQCWRRRRTKDVWKRGSGAVNTTEMEKLAVSEQEATIGNGV